MANAAKTKLGRLAETLSAVVGGKAKPSPNPPRRANENMLIEAVGFPSAQTRAAIVRFCGIQISPEDRRQVDELQKQWLQAGELIRKYSYGNVNAAWKAEQAKLNDVKTIDAAEAWDKEDFIEEYRQKMAAAKKVQARISEQAYELLKKYAQVFADSCDAAANRIEEAEAAVADAFAVSYQPSLAVLMCRRLGRDTVRFSSSLASASAMSPADLAAWVSPTND